MGRELSDAEVFGAQEMSDDDVFGPAAAPPAKARRKSFSLGFDEGFAKPVDRFAVAIDSGLQRIGVPMDKVNRAVGQPTTAETNAKHQNIFADREKIAQPSAAGQVVGNIFGTAPIAVATRNPAIGGGLSGALLGNGDTPTGVAGDVAGGAALGWGGGKVLDAAADFIKPAIDPAVKMLRDAGVKLTPGMMRSGKAMIREDKSMSKPFVGDAIRADRSATQDTFNTASVNRALEPLGVKLPDNVKPGFDAISYAKSKVGDAYDEVIPNLKVRINGQSFAEQLAPAAQSLEPAQRAQFQALLNAHLKDGKLDGQALKTAQGELRRLAAKYSRDPAAANNELGQALWAADDQLSSAMMEQNPNFALQLQAANKAYRGYRLVADAASRGDDGLFNTGQLKQSVRRGDFSKNKDAAARGDAFMQDWSNAARDVIPGRYPDSGTAGRSPNIFAKIGGAGEGINYEISKQLEALRFAPRPAGAGRVASGVKRLKQPVQVGAVTAAYQRRD